MPTKIQKWGNSLAIRLPKDIAKRFKLRQGSDITLVPDSRQLIIKPASRKNQTLREMVDAITPENRHGEISWGKRTGKEVW